MGSLNVLALNSGSSSLKFGLYRVDSTGAEKLVGECVATDEHPDAMTRVGTRQRDAPSLTGFLAARLCGSSRLTPIHDSPAQIPVRTWASLVLASQENEQIARHAWALLA